MASHRPSALQIVFCEAAAKSLLFGKVVGVVEGSKIGDSFFCFIARVGIDELNAIARRESIEKIHQSIFVILIESPAGFAMLERSLDNEKVGREGQELFHFV